jgi:hypothetical protein
MGARHGAQPAMQLAHEGHDGRCRAARMADQRLDIRQRVPHAMVEARVRQVLPVLRALAFRRHLDPAPGPAAAAHGLPPGGQAAARAAPRACRRDLHGLGRIACPGDRLHDLLAEPDDAVARIARDGENQRAGGDIREGGSRRIGFRQPFEGDDALAR